MLNKYEINNNCLLSRVDNMINSYDLKHKHLQVNIKYSGEIDLLIYDVSTFLNVAEAAEKDVTRDETKLYIKISDVVEFKTYMVDGNDRDVYYTWKRNQHNEEESNDGKESDVLSKQ